MPTPNRKPKIVRFTIAIPETTYAAYKEMGALSGMSVSRTIAGWLGDTLDGARMVNIQMAEAKAAPQRVLSNLLASTQGTKELILRAKEEVRRRDE
jgi:hypothetical protein